MLLMAAAIVAQYALLNGIYRPENTDDAFSLSFLYNFHHRGVEIDDVFGNAYQLERQNGVTLFGKLQAYLYGPILDLFGWSRVAAHAVSTSLILATALCWSAIVRRITSDSKLAMGFGLLLLWTEPVFAAANQARPDALTLLLSALSLYAIAVERPTLAGVLACAAVETHPMGAVAVTYVAAWTILRINRDRRLTGAAPYLGRLLLGALFGIAGYLALHWPSIGELVPVLTLNSGGAPGGFLYAFFFQTEYLRHIPELVLFLVAFASLLRFRELLEDRLLDTLLISGLIVVFLFRRENFQYAVYMYPLFIYVLLIMFRRIRKQWMPLVLYAVLLVPQYTFVYIRNHDFGIDEYLRAVTGAVPMDDLPVIGTPNAWFAFHERRFYAIEYRNEWLFDLDLAEFYLVGSPYDSLPTAPGTYARLREAYSCVSIAQPQIYNKPVMVERCSRPKTSQIK